MIPYSHLLTVDHLVSDTRIVWVNLELNVCHTFYELTVVNKAYNHRAIQRVLALYQKLFHTLFVVCDVGIVHVWGYFHQYLHQDSIDLDKGHVLFIFYSRLNKCVRDIYYSDIPIFLCINNA